jgi:GDPmannose 4,6-dehydratase
METAASVSGRKTALITGGSGQDGAYLTSLLLKKGYFVVITTRSAEPETALANLHRLGPFERERVAIKTLSLEDDRAIVAFLESLAPDEIYHLAGQSSVGLSFARPKETFVSIAVSCQNLLEGLRVLGLPTRFFNASSGDCFGDTGGVAAIESTPFQPRSPYAIAKASSFWQTRTYREAYGVYACSALLFNHESPLRPECFVTGKIIQTVRDIAVGRASKLHLGNIDIQRDWGWAPEFVEGMWEMLQQDAPDDFILATGKTFALREFVEQAFACFGLDWRQYTISDPGLLRSVDVLISKADPVHAKQCLGWKAESAMPEIVRLMLEKQE